MCLDEHLKVDAFPRIDVPSLHPIVKSRLPSTVTLFLQRLQSDILPSTVPTADVDEPLEKSPEATLEASQLGEAVDGMLVVKCTTF